MFLLGSEQNAFLTWKEHFAMILGLQKEEKIIVECLLADIKMFK